MDVHELAELAQSTTHDDRAQVGANGGPTARRPLRGLLPVPAAVQRLIDADERPMTDSARKYIKDRYLLQYHFGGQYVLYRTVPEGVEVLAVGDDEVGRVPRVSPGDEGYMAVGADIVEWGWDR